MILSTKQINDINAMKQLDTLIIKTDDFDKTKFKIEMVTDDEYRVVLQTVGRFCLRSEYATGTDDVFSFIKTWS